LSVFFLFESREKKKEAGSNTEHKKKRERTEQIRVERKEIEHSADKPHYTEKRDFD
jgi:hypothetical protein